jgi:DtxR family Mn-dependent transcriptional regulator
LGNFAERSGAFAGQLSLGAESLQWRRVRMPLRSPDRAAFKEGDRVWEQAAVTSLTVENYLKAIYQISGTRADQSATTGTVAQTLNVSPGTVTSMLKTLSETGLATYMPYEGVKLTAAGNALALRVLRRHRLIELFLVETLKLTWDEVHEEAENMEHAVSDLLVDRIDAFLGHPKADPHGDPIPSAEGELENPASRSLAECPAGAEFRIARVIDQSPEFLRFLTESQLALGSRGKVLSNRLEAGVVKIQVNGQDAMLGRQVAEKILVTS